MRYDRARASLDRHATYIDRAARGAERDQHGGWPLPAMAPAANASTGAIGGIALTISSVVPAANSVPHAAHRQGWLSQDEAAHDQRMTSPGWRYRDRPRSLSGFMPVPGFPRRRPAAARRPGGGVG